MHNPRFLRLARQLLPRWLRARLDPFHDRIETGLSQFAAGLPEGARVLDAGAGECPFRPLFDKVRYVAIDSAVGDAAWDYSHLSVAGDLTALPFADASFDAAISTVVLEHVADPLAALFEVRRVLRPGGQLFIAVPQFWELHQAPHDFFRYTRHGLDHLLQQAGFATLRLEPTGGYFQLMGKLSIDFLQFFQRNVLWLVWLGLAPFFGLLFPFVCYYLDKLDRDQAFAIGFIAVAQAGAMKDVAVRATHKEEIAVGSSA